MSLLDRLKDSLDRVVRRLFVRLDYSCLYGATVASQNGDGSLELTPTGTKLPPLSNVPIRYGIPGIAVTVKPGALVLVGFADADPSQVYAILISGDAAGVQAIQILGGTQPVARQGDAVSVPLPQTVLFSGTISGLPASGTITIPPTMTTGIIVAGNPNVTA